MEGRRYNSAMTKAQSWLSAKIDTGKLVKRYFKYFFGILY